MYRTDFKKLIKWWLPEWLRKSTVMIVLYAWSLPVRRRYDDFVRFVDDTLYFLNHNSQVCYLRGALNDSFDIDLRRIVIDNFNGIERIYFWREVDRRDIDFTNDVFFWSEDDYGDSGVDFTVSIPANVATTDAEMKRLISTINKYKLPGKKYSIVRL